jgi:transposase-like protein
MASGEVIMSSKRYPEEFKIKAVKQVVDPLDHVIKASVGLHKELR